MDTTWLTHPDVLKMVRLAVKRKMRMFAAYRDLDFNSLVADMMGELANAKYDPTESKPGTFAYRVATCRLIDISRRRTVETKHLNAAREVEGVKLSHVGPGEMLEGTEAELAEIARRLYVTTMAYFVNGNVPVKRSGPGRPALNRAQQATLHMLQKQMGWTCRQAERKLKENSAIYAAIGVTKPLSHQFFHRASIAVTKFKDFFPPASRAAVL